MPWAFVSDVSVSVGFGFLIVLSTTSNFATISSCFDFAPPSPPSLAAMSRFVTTNDGGDDAEEDDADAKDEQYAVAR